MTRLVVLGSTGSIGTQTLDVAADLGLAVAGLGANQGSDRLLEQAGGWPDAQVVVSSPTPSERERFSEALGGRVTFGPVAVNEMAATPGATVVNGIVGSAGLRPSLAALEAGNRLALANKETLIVGGDLVTAARERGRAELVPVDSEHSALAQCLRGEAVPSVRRIILTASGGPFRGRSTEDLEDVTVKEALAHPTWDMGRRITIDSATLMNKALEVIEAHHLFGVDYDDIDVVVHPESIVHSMVEFVDGSIKAQLGHPDMRLPIQYAITAPDRSARPDTGWTLAGALHFEPPDVDAFPCLALGYRAGRQGGSSTAVLNAADEIAVQAFLDGRIGFTSIPIVVEAALDGVEHREIRTVDDALEADKEARAVAYDAIGRYC